MEKRKTDISAESLQLMHLQKFLKQWAMILSVRVLEGDGTPRSLINIYINGKNAKFANGMETPLNDGDEVYIYPLLQVVLKNFLKRT